MALRLTGSDECELLIIETKEFILNIKGRPFHPTAQGLSILPSPEDAGDGATLHIAGAYISAHSYDPGRSSHLREYLPGVLVHPCFFEQTIYQVVIENKTQTPLVFFHPYQKYRNRVGPIGSTGRILVGNLNFENEVGLFTFQISKSGAPLLDVTLEVFPSKLDYRGDYLRLIEEVNKEVYGLAYDLLRSTYMGAKQQASRPATRNEYVSIIRVVFASLENAVLRIMRSPHQALVTSYETIRVDKARRADSTTRKSLLRARHWTTSECGLTVNGTKMAPRSIQDARKKVSHDTYENRVLKWMLQSVSVRLADSIKRLEATNSQSQELSAELKVMQRRLTGMLKHQLLAEVGVVHRIDGPSLVLQLAPGYRDVYKYFLMLQRGLFLQNSLFKLSLKDIALLYEYWCYLALGGLFRHKYDLKRQTVIAIKERGLVVMLDRTQKSELEFCNRFSGERYTLRYNPSQQGLPTTGQRPDTILTLEKNGSGVQYKYILDAKYRINPALPGTFYGEAYGSAGPEEEDINTMHRYRDAMVFRRADGRYGRGVFGAVVLFPYSKEDLYGGGDGKPHQFYSSIEEVGVGGLPFLPGHTKLVEQFLDDLILSSPETVYERATMTEGTEDYYEERFAKRSVLVGAVRTREHLSWHLASGRYHMPQELLPKGFAHIEYIALYEREEISPSAAGIRYFAKVISASVVDRSEIGGPPSKRTGLYVLFQLESWVALPMPVRPAGYGVRSRLYTTIFLLKEAKILPELSLRSAVEMRVWKELRRLSCEIKTLANKAELDEAKIAGFTVGDVHVRVVGEELRLDEVTLPLVEVHRKPVSVLRRIISLMRSEG